MKSSIIFYIILLSIILKSCCITSDCEGCQGLTTYDKHFFCYVYEKSTNETIVGHCLKCPYSEIGSVLVNQNGDTLKYEGTITSGGGMRFPLIIRGKDSTDYPIHQEYYLHLVDFDGIERDVDTLKFDFILVNSDRCEKYDFKDFRCYFNDSLYLTEYKWNKEGGRVIFYK